MSYDFWPLADFTQLASVKNVKWVFKKQEKAAVGTLKEEGRLHGGTKYSFPGALPVTCFQLMGRKCVSLFWPIRRLATLSPTRFSHWS